MKKKLKKNGYNVEMDVCRVKWGDGLYTMYTPKNWKIDEIKKN